MRHCLWILEKRSLLVAYQGHWKLVSTIEKKFLIWISRSFKKGASNNTISYFDQFFRFSGLWLILARELGRSCRNKSRGTENRERTNDYFFFKFSTVHVENLLTCEQNFLKQNWWILSWTLTFDIVGNSCQTFSYDNQHKQCGHFRIGRSPCKDGELALFRNKRFMLDEMP